MGETDYSLAREEGVQGLGWDPQVLPEYRGNSYTPQRSLGHFIELLLETNSNWPKNKQTKKGVLGTKTRQSFAFLRNHK